MKANRRNALKSTGPRTPEGKAAVALNGIKHGLLSRETLVQGELEADRSNSANEPIICIIMRPAGVAVSMFSVID